MVSLTQKDLDHTLELVRDPKMSMRESRSVLEALINAAQMLAVRSSNLKKHTQS